MRRGTKVVLGVALALVVLGIAAVAALVVLVAIKNRAPSVPATFHAPTEAAPATGAAAPGTLFYDSDRSGNFELYRAPEPGADPTALTDDPTWDSWWPRLSPDRQRVLFYRTPKGVHDQDFAKAHLWVANADGSNQVELRPPGLDGWVQQGHAEWSPDGTRIVMFGGSRTNPQIQITDHLGQHPTRITSRGGVNIDPSWSPDGRSIVFVGCPRSVCFPEDQEIYRIDEAGGKADRMTTDHLRDQDPYYSPDGTQLAWLTQTSKQGRHPTGGSWNIRISNADGSQLRRLTDDDQINSKPEWSRDGRTIFFHRFETGRLTGFSIFAIGTDGSGMHEVTPGQPGVNEFPST